MIQLKIWEDWSCDVLRLGKSVFFVRFEVPTVKEANGSTVSSCKHWSIDIVVNQAKFIKKKFAGDFNSRWLARTSGSLLLLLFLLDMRVRQCSLTIRSYLPTPSSKRVLQP